MGTGIHYFGVLLCFAYGVIFFKCLFHVLIFLDQYLFEYEFLQFFESCLMFFPKAGKKKKPRNSKNGC